MMKITDLDPTFQVIADPAKLPVNFFFFFAIFGSKVIRETKMVLTFLL